MIKQTKLLLSVLCLTLGFTYSFAQNCINCTSSSPLNSGLLFCTPMQGNANDAIATPMTPVISGATVLTPDRLSNPNSAYDFSNISTARIFYGSASKMSIPNTQSFSISIWFYTRSIHTMASSLINLNSDNLSAYTLFVGGTNHGSLSGKLVYSDYSKPANISGSPISSDSAVTLNAWHHAVISVDRGTGAHTLYLDGVLDTAGSAFMNPPITNGFITLGNHDINAWGINGKLDDARIYNRALTSTEVAQLYAATPITYTPISDKTICSGDSVQLIANWGTSYAWSPATGLSDPTIANPYAKPASTQQYIVTITNGLCSTTDTVVVNVNTNCCFGCITPTTINTGLVACYPFNGNANDASSNGNNGTVSAGAVLSTNRISLANKAYQFDGSSNAQIKVVAAPSLNTGTMTAFTFSCWFNPATFSPSAQSAYRRIFNIQDASNRNYDLSYHYASNKLSFINFNGSSDNINFTSNTVFSPNSWYHVAVIIGTDNKPKLYINGILDNSSTTSVLKPANPTYTIGNHFVNSWNFSGKLDDIRIYNRALTTVELSQLNMQKEAPAYTHISDKTICLGDSIQLTATGGSSYSWSPSTGLSNVTIANPYSKPSDTTKYVVSISNQICVATDTVSVNVNTINPVFGNAQRVCIGDSAQFSASGGTSYKWSPSTGLSDSAIANPKVKTLTTKAYQITIIKGACKAVDSISVQVDTLISVNVGPDLNMCFGDSIQLSVQGADTYTWSPAIHLSNAGIANPFATPTNTIDYIVQGQRGACSNKDTLRITVCQCGLITGYDTIAVYDSITVYDTLTVAIYDTTVIMHHVFDTVIVAHHTFDTVTVHQIIYDSVRVSVTDTLIIDLFTGISPPGGLLTTIKVFPNPAHDRLFITIDDFAHIPNHRIKITNVLGQTKFDQVVNQQTFNIDISTLGGTGTYFLQILNPAGQTIDTRKVLVK